MIVHLYKDCELAVPLKHGSRFVRTHYSELMGDMVEVSTRSLEWLSSVKWVVLRDPIELLQSALHTEIIDNDYLYDADKVNNLLSHHYYRAHYGNHFDIEFCKCLYESGVDFKVIPLKELSTFLFQITGKYIKSYKIKDWIPKHDTPMEMSREKFWYEFCKRYPTDSLKLVELAIKDKEYYDLLIKEKELKVKPKIL